MQHQIRIYIGKIQEWTKDLPEHVKKRQSICGKRLLAFGLCEQQPEFPYLDRQDIQKIIEHPEEVLEKGAHGKPCFKDFPEIHFNISHSGEYAACAVGPIPCGLDIQETRPFRSMRLLQRTMSREEQTQILEAEDPDAVFCRFWAMKESFLKLSGEGITRSMTDLPFPGWYEMLPLPEGMTGCISAGEACTVLFREVPAEEFYKIFYTGKSSGS